MFVFAERPGPRRAMQNSPMPTTMTEHDERRVGPLPGRHLKLALAISVVVLLAAVLTGWHVWTDRQPTIYSAIDAYTSAVESGDRTALEAIIAEGPGREALLQRHAGKPSTVTGVTTEMSVSAVWWQLEIRYELPGQEQTSEHLLVRPRSESPDRLIDYAISPAP
jgi:hypothetical protein